MVPSIEPGTKVNISVEMPNPRPFAEAKNSIELMIPEDNPARQEALDALNKFGTDSLFKLVFKPDPADKKQVQCVISTFDPKPGKRPGEFEMEFNSLARLKPFENADKSKDQGISTWLTGDEGQSTVERLKTLEDAKIKYKAVLIRDQSTREVKSCPIIVTPGEIQATKEERIQGIVSKGLDEGAKLVGATLEDVFYGHPGEVDLNLLPNEIKREFSRILQGKNEVSAQMLENWYNILEVLPPEERQAWLKKFPTKAIQARITGYAALFGDFGWKILKDVLGEKVETNKWGKRAVDNVPTLSSLMTIALREVGDKKVRKIVREQKQSEEPETVYVASAEPQAA